MFNLLQLVTWEDFYDYRSPLLTYPLTSSTLLPFDLSLLSIFLLYHLSITDYIGRSDLDQAQHLAIRVMPFLTCLLDLLMSTSTKTHTYRYLLLTLWLAQLIHFIFFDWSRSFESPFSDIANADDYQSANINSSSEHKAKKVIIENNRERYKMIVYRERGDGGIQGILMDFYIEEETGQIANEFLRIHEREDGEIELVKIEQGIRPIMDKGLVEKVFKQSFLKMD